MSTNKTKQLDQAQASYTAAEAKAEKARQAAQAAADLAKDAERQRAQAQLEHQGVRTARDADVNRATAAAAPARMNHAAEAQAVALAKFRAEVEATAWGAALIEWMAARHAARAWDARHSASLRALGGTAGDAASSYSAPPVLAGEDLASLMANVITVAGVDAARADEANVDNARRNYIDGTTDDPTPPA